MMRWLSFMTRAPAQSRPEHIIRKLMTLDARLKVTSHELQVSTYSVTNAERNKIFEG
jgi:hypothetical protein